MKEILNDIDFVRPEDWPDELGPIDLKVHDLPHKSSSMEWWYMNGHFTGESNQEYSVFASFFRKLINVDKETGVPEYAHSITWAIIDVENEAYYNNSLVDKKTPEIGLEQLRKGELVKDKYLRNAAIEMLEKNVVPYPDRLFDGEVIVDSDRLNLTYDTNTFEVTEEGEYILHCFDKEHRVSLSLRFTPDKPPIRHGDDGIVFRLQARDMFYYFIPSCTATGNLVIEGTTIEVEGSIWYDHEFGRENPGTEEKELPAKDDSETSWDWMSCQLDNGYEIGAYKWKDLDQVRISGSCLLIIDDQGERHKIDDFIFEPEGEMWTSMRTFQDYPLRWILKAPQIGLDLVAEASFPVQEFSTVISRPAFWEGRMILKGELFHEPVEGLGFFEINGFNILETLEDFFKVVSRETIKSIDHILPRNPDQDKLNELITKKDSGHFSKGVDVSVYNQSVIEPIRAIIDRGGKAWRSYAALACCDIVGGNVHNFRTWLSLPELMHVGSLIVDDVEDGSKVRRGGPSCHEMHGMPIAINAGTACYFISQICINDGHQIDESDKIKIYEYYFESLRAGHSGQALDIYGMDYLMEGIVEDNSGNLLEERVLAVHKLKCAAPAYYLAKIGGVIGQGSELQVNALATFFECLGMAFQIIDDTLNLAGFKDNLKTKAEDISAGKITYPIAIAMHRLEQVDRRRLWEILQEKTVEKDKISEAIKLLDKVDALKSCEEEAHRIMDEGWHALDPHVRDSMVKLNLRAFSWFVLERHY